MENKSLVDLIRSLVSSNKEIQNLIREQKTEIAEELKLLRKELLENLLKVKEENKAFKIEVQQLKEKLNKVERESKRYKLIIHGFEEGKDEISDLGTCLDIINSKLGVECRFSDVRNFFRLGQPSVQKHRAASLEVVNYFLKKEILKNSKKLKQTQIYINHDRTDQEQAEHKLLYRHLKIAKENNKEAYIRNKVLFINGQSRTPEDLKKEEAMHLLRLEFQRPPPYPTPKRKTSSSDSKNPNHPQKEPLEVEV
ncbi:uncharacterized protein LOC126735662 [Anthonomus grandis grandis]|uniref:uncharacterized protein LOC126735662 n=1 Tax=Anthonomus grandis grandis TaxID=2921223 RepID=UPI002166B835|nr:uncharacterized protein LOC126735662 [Anthonomus grandis grandis]